MSFLGGYSEDAVILLLIRLLGLRCSNLRYLEIGTNNPVNGNNSYALYECGARGVLVDALPNFKYLIEMFRPEDIFIQAAVVDTESELQTTFYLPNRGDDKFDFGIGSLSQEWANQFPGIVGTTTFNVEAININDLIERISFIPDILLIDAEGYDEKILRGIEYSRFKPTIIIAELGIPNQGLVSFMDEKGYLFFSNIGNCNTVFVCQEKWAGRVLF